MKKAKKIIEEIESSIKRLDLFMMSLKTLVLLMVSYLILFVLDIQPFYAMVPAIVYLVSSVFVEARFDKVKRVEKKYANLDEKLRTARDYQDKENSVLEELEKEIVRDIKDVKLSAFFPYIRTFMLVFLLVAAVSLSLYISSKDLRLIDFDVVMQEAMKRFAQEEEMLAEEADFTGGERSIMQVGNERIEVEINPVGIDFDFSEMAEPGDYEFSTAFPRDVFISSGASYENEFTEEQQILIRRYFDNKNK